MNKFIHLLFANPPRNKTKQSNLLVLITIVVVLLFLFMAIPSLKAQNIGINTTGSTPNASALLDVDASPGNDKGLLIPRLTTAQRNAITAPIPESLLIYNTTTQCFEAWNNTTSTWVAFGCIGCQLPGAFTATSATNIAQTAFDANWSASVSATTYFLDVATDAAFTTFVSGYNNLNVGNVTTNNITGLTCATDYYYRVRAENSCGTSGNSNTITLTTGACCNITATGGTITSSGGKTIHTFTSSGTFNVTCAAPGATVEVVVVGGGGSGGYGVNAPAVGGGGGGGGGGYKYNPSFSVSIGSYTVVVGAGGSGTMNAGINGDASSFDALSAIGGGYGGVGTCCGSGTINGGNGGSGGGGGGLNSGASSGGTCCSDGSTGSNGFGTSSTTGGNGGGASGTGQAGKADDITGSIVAAGGIGRGRSVGSNGNGAANSGNGGGGSFGVLSGAGGSGIVIISYTP